jgi:mRNA-degrading endonuclease RelE of RelBE toxin-antitoxin system
MRPRVGRSGCCATRCWPASPGSELELVRDRLGCECAEVSHRLPEKIATACVEFVFGGLAENPQRVGRALRFDLEGKRSARRGDFRVIYEIDEQQRVVTVIAIDHRGDVYRNT